jgi:signal transduction histidine kinase
VLAYVVGLGREDSGSTAWLEGHVRAADFPRLFSIPPHLMAGAELGVLDEVGNPIFDAHEHGLEQIVAGAADLQPDTAIVARGGTPRTPFMVAIAPVEDVGWYVAAVLPLDVALAPVSRMRDFALGGTAILVALLVVTGALAARTVTTPLTQLAGAVQEFGRSESFTPVRPRTRDELGSLVWSFNRMAEDLIRSRREIERLHEAELERTHQLATVGELASGVAHEIRNPLTGVLGAIELALKRLPPNDPSRPLLDEAELQLRRMEATTTQLLRYARPPELRAVVVDANLLIDRAIRVIEPQARAGRVALLAEPTAEPAPVRVDPEQVVQVLVNLGLNALQAMTDGGRLTLRVARRDGSAEVTVADTGPGVPPDVVRDVFRPFFTTKHQGTGLGLSISQQLIERHGGALRLEDTPGGGATFVVVLPLQEEGEAS